MVRMKVLVYLQMASLVSSLVIRVPERSKRDSGRNICKEESVTIYPEVAQNTEGQIKFIVQRNATHSSLQPVDITTCIHPGSSCSGCSTKHSPVLPTVCSNKYKVSHTSLTQLNN